MINRKTFICGISSCASLAGIGSLNSILGAEKADDNAITFFMIADWHLRMKDKPPSTVIVDKLEKKIKALKQLGGLSPLAISDRKLWLV